MKEVAQAHLYESSLKFMCMFPNLSFCYEGNYLVLVHSQSQLQQAIYYLSLKKCHLTVEKLSQSPEPNEFIRKVSSTGLLSEWNEL